MKVINFNEYTHCLICNGYGDTIAITNSTPNISIGHCNEKISEECCDYKLPVITIEFDTFSIKAKYSDVILDEDNYVIKVYNSEILGGINIIFVK